MGLNLINTDFHFKMCNLFCLCFPDFLSKTIHQSTVVLPSVYHSIFSEVVQN